MKFIESKGSAKENEKRRAKKERQKAQKAEEARRREEELRKKVGLHYSQEILNAQKRDNFFKFQDFLNDFIHVVNKKTTTTTTGRVSV